MERHNRHNVLDTEMLSHWRSESVNQDVRVIDLEHELPRASKNDQSTQVSRRQTLNDALLDRWVIQVDAVDTLRHSVTD